MPKTNAQKTKDYEDSQKAKGFVKFCLWVKPEWKDKIRDKVKELTNK